ncbi:hypothetical protein Hanom_Chr08g00736781 [Helianthus anomalus]
MFLSVYSRCYQIGFEIRMVVNSDRNRGDVDDGFRQWRSLRFSTGEAEIIGPKSFYKTGGLKTYIPKNFYTKTTYFPLLSEKFGGSAAPSRPLKALPMVSG